MTPAEPSPVEHEETRIRRMYPLEPEHQHVRWRSIFAGFFIATAAQLVLSLLGVAVGLTAVSPAGGVTLEDVGLGAALWMIGSTLVALFLGGFAAARLSGMPRRSEGIVQGLLTWALSTAFVVYLVGAGLGMAAGATERLPAEARRAAERPGATAQQLGREMQRAAGSEAAQRVAWFTLAGVGVSLVAALAGGAAGVKRRRIHEREEPRAPTPVVP